MQLSTSLVETSEKNPTQWAKTLNTSFLSTLIESVGQESRIQMDLETLLKSPEYAAILMAAQNLSSQLGIDPELATERLVQTFRSMDSCWQKILLKKGAESLLKSEI